MATVHLGTLSGSGTFARTVAIKRLHPQLSKDPEFVSMFLDEARLASRIRHPNIVSTLDVVVEGAELFLVMEYVHGESVSGIQRTLRAKGEVIDPAFATAIMVGVLLGLHAAHDATSELGDALHIVHRDISPQNVLVGADGVARVVDFGVAKAIGRLQTTREGQVKGKAAYMAPEQLTGDDVDRRADVYAASVVLWEMLVGKRLFMADTPARSMLLVLEKPIEAPSALRPELPAALDAIVLKGLARDPQQRFASAREMALALQKAIVPAASTDVSDWVATIAGEALRHRAELIARIERAAIEGVEVAASAPPRREPAADDDHQTITHISGVSSGIGTRARRSVRVGAAGLLVVAAVVACGAIALRLRGSRTAPAYAFASTSASASASTSASTSASSSSSAAELPAAPPPERSAIAAPSITPTAPSAASRPVAGARPARTVTTRAVPAAPAAPKSPKAGCSPAYTVDANGIHIPKPECL